MGPKTHMQEEEKEEGEEQEELLLKLFKLTEILHKNTIVFLMIKNFSFIPQSYLLPSNWGGIGG